MKERAMDVHGESLGSIRLPSTTLRRARLSSLIGSVIEWYDFFIYGTAAALVFGHLFFPNTSPFAATMASFGTFAVGFVARPVGGIIFGHFGDRLGRKTVLVATLGIMGLSTCLVGLLPTYATIGIWAPVLLTLLRLVQGIALGGEWGGAVLMVVEHAPAHRRGWHSAWPQMGVPVGLLLSTGVITLVAALSGSEFESWGWRVPFVLSIVLVAVGLFIRIAVEETPVFAAIERKKQVARFPVVEVFRRKKKRILIAIGARFAENGSFFIFSVFSLSYATQYLHVPRGVILGAVVLGALATTVTIPLFGLLTDRFGRRPIFIGGSLFTLVFAFPFFLLLRTGEPMMVALALVLALAIGWAAMYAPQAAYFAELFEPQVRYSGMSIGAQLVAIVAGGPSPLIATAGLAWSGGEPWPISLWLMLVSTITFVTLLVAPETAGCHLGTDDDAARRVPLAAGGASD
jgi:MHS family shikimate/dehydroshikimate transporter-like MFS transporter